MELLNQKCIYCNRQLRWQTFAYGIKAYAPPAHRVVLACEGCPVMVTNTSIWAFRVGGVRCVVLKRRHWGTNPGEVQREDVPP